MKEPTIRVELDDGTGTWVTIIPIRQLDWIGATRAAGEAFAWFLSRLALDGGAVDQHLDALKSDDRPPDAVALGIEESWTDDPALD